MKMKSYARRNALLPRGVGSVALAAVLIAAVAVAARIAMPGLFISAFSPVWRLGSFASAGAASAASVFSNPVALQKELDSARAQSEELTNENAALAAQVRDLQNLLGSRTEAAPGVLAGVLARPPLSGYDALIADQGSAAGVVPGSLVRGPGGVAVGTVASVTSRSSRIALYSSPGTETPIWVGDKRAALTMTGAGAGAFEAAADREAGIAAGDLVYTGGPGAVPLGFVARVDSDPSSPSVTLRIQAAVNPFSMTWVTIDRAAP